MTENLELTRPPVTRTGMLVRRPVAEVFEAWVDPAVTTRLWFTKSSGKLVAGRTVRWEWEMYGVGADVAVRELVDDELIVFEWGEVGSPQVVEVRFTPYGPDRSYVEVTEAGYVGSADDVVAHALDSSAGFTMVLCGMKAFLEHGIALGLVADKSRPATRGH